MYVSLLIEILILKSLTSYINKHLIFQLGLPLYWKVCLILRLFNNTVTTAEVI